MIKTNDLSKQFKDFWAVDGVSLKVPAGQVLALLGPNGAGKTTTVRMLTSILKPTRGWAKIAGYDVAQQPHRVRASVGVLTEHHGLYTRMPAQEYLEFYGQIYHLDKAICRTRINRLLEHFGLQEFRNRRIGEYSKGMRQKLALARALLHEPPVLLLDEPTSAMDPESARLVRDAIRDLRSAERTIVICTHNLSEAEKLADQIGIIRRGRIIARGTPESLKHSLLGPPEYELSFANGAGEYARLIPVGTEVTMRAEHRFRYRSADPEQENPALLRRFLDAGLPVVHLNEVPRSLEQVYLQAVASPDQEEAQDAG